MVCAPAPFPKGGPLMLSLLLSPFFLLSGLCGVLIFFCFRTQTQSHRIVLLLSAIACGLIAFASTNPIPGSEGPGLLALMGSGVAAGAALILLIVRMLPKPFPIPRSPAVRMSGWLLGTFGISAVAAFAVAVMSGSSYDGAAISVCVVVPTLYGFSGWLMPKSNHPTKLSAALTALLLFALIPGAVIFWSCASDSMWATYFSILTFPHRTIAEFLFSPLYYGHKSALVLDILLPLCVSSIQLLLAAAFGIGMLVKYQEAKK